MSKRSTNLNRGHKSARLSASNLLGLMDALGLSADEQRGIAQRARGACVECGAPAEVLRHYHGAGTSLPLCRRCAEHKDAA
jgi:ribosomal protein S14